MVLQKKIEDAKPALNNMKTEIANELGITSYQDYQEMDKGKLTSRQNGNVGGYLGGSMTKKLVEMAEQQLSGK
ncbi:alpha/beta-type small acid-soluble spore protein [Sinanaerobacter chloroacetimidivorans]|uniref:Alpha/beta-type small acid-soluble spore protein n=1 Tax=Sinanaerobacter chloroacetimidivorans TaxID=2818044 RepID=A0A8J8B0E3_9FIRM|nr:alpha/beta-type small acid-soluble spore protein [Sinanaerobacter chloroacetimidivorans]MBR0596531.1 alpha/beta-type small acid-soluble spore protein [Sinanaerobacter chloroacetimidivorans]